MKRRNFVKIAGIGVTGYPFSSFFNSNLLPPHPALAFAEMFVTSLFGRKGAEAAAGAVVSWIVPKVLDWWFEDDSNDNCCSKTMDYMKSNDYHPYQDDHKANFFYSPRAKPVQPSMPSSISEYGAFTFTKKKPIANEENTMAVFLAKTHESKTIATAIPESLMIACILVAKKLVERKGMTYEDVQQRLLPIAILSEKTTIEGAFSSKMYKTAFGSITLKGAIVERDSNNIPTKISGILEINSEKDQNGVVKTEPPHDLSEENLDFLYESIKLGKR